MHPSELELLPLDKLHEFNLYYGKKLIGYLNKADNGWSLITPRSESEVEIKILPAQIESVQPIDSSNSRGSQTSSTKIVFDGTPSFKTLVIIGAGASFDYSFDDKVRKPPLTNGLFDDSFHEIISQFPGVQNLSSQILKAKNIEAYFQQQWEKVVKTHNPMLLNNLIDVQYYLQNLLRDFSSNIDYRKNNYISFFQALRDAMIAAGPDEKTLVVSFNYDTILEQSLTKALNYNYKSLDSYVGLDKKILVFKPHGSWNWVKKFSRTFLSSIGIELNVPFEAVNIPLHLKEVSLSKINNNLESSVSVIDQLHNTYHFPQLLLPYQQKDEFVMPDAHLSLLKHFLSQVERIFIIGWKGAEEKFKKLLSSELSSKDISIYCATANDTTIEKEIKKILPSGRFSMFSPYARSKGTFTELNAFIQEYPDRLFSHYN